jgi:hypothetical protein
MSSRGIVWKVKFLFAGGGHQCETVRDAGFGGKENGELLALADKSFDVLITIDFATPFLQSVFCRHVSI